MVPGIEKTRLRVASLLLMSVLFTQFSHAQKTSRWLITKCWEDISRLDTWRDYEPIVAEGRDGIAILLNAKGAEFSVELERRTIFTFTVPDLSSNAEVLWSPDGKSFALNYSDGGAIGGFHVRLFAIDDDKVTEVSRAIEPAVNEFKSRHYCKTRGNNVTALKWLPDSTRLVLMTDVYPTGDCGPDLGHTEGYVVTIPDGKIERHLTLKQLRISPASASRTTANDLTVLPVPNQSLPASSSNCLILTLPSGNTAQISSDPPIASI